MILLNETIDAIHSLFPVLMPIGVVCVVMSYLPLKSHFESHFDVYFTWILFTFGCLFASYLYSQALLGGCFIHIPQNWIARQYLGKSEWWPFGLYGRYGWPFDLITLRLLYIVLSVYSTIRLYVFYVRRIPRFEGPV